MPNNIEWVDKEHTVVRATLDDVTKAQDILHTWEAVCSLISQVDHTVDVIWIDTMKQAPAGMLSAVQRIQSEVPENIGNVFLVGGNQDLLKMMHEFTIGFRRNDYINGHTHFCETEQDALAILERIGQRRLP